MGAVTFGIPRKLVSTLQEIFQIDTFIETGTFQGKTTQWAARNFKQVYTVENSKTLYEDAVKKLAVFPNIQCHLGNSAEKLGEILKDIHTPAILWLDAHWCGGATYGENDECPLMQEIESVYGSPHEHIIIIDDARYFSKPPAQTHQSNQWPGLNDLIPALSKKKGYYTFICEDVIVAMPATGMARLQPYFNEIHKIEFPGGGIIKNLQFAFRNILNKWKS
jgi:hypothetical protein